MVYIKHEHLSPVNLKHIIITRQAEIQVRSPYFQPSLCTKDFTSAVLLQSLNRLKKKKNTTDYKKPCEVI